MRRVAATARCDKPRIVPTHDRSGQSADADECSTQTIRLEAPRDRIGMAAEADEQPACGCRRISRRDNQHVAPAERCRWIGDRGTDEATIDACPIGNTGEFLVDSWIDHD
jgi:hypothetical protein